MHAAGVVAVIALFLGYIWLNRAQSARRWKGALDAYAARETARGRRRQVPPL
jgi:hypothetical protein